MSLTLTEAFDRIKAIDSEPDIIRQACSRYIIEAIFGEQQDEMKVSAELLAKAKNAFPETADAVKVLVIAATGLASQSVHPGKEVEVLFTMLETVKDYYLSGIKFRVTELMKDNPEKGIEILHNMVEGYAEMSKKFTD